MGPIALSGKRRGTKNFRKFTVRLSERKNPQPNEEYYRHLIAKTILFKQAEKLVQKQQYGGYRANIVTYTLAYLSYKTAQRIDLDRIWKEQSLTSALENEVVEVSKFVQQMIVNPPGGANVGEWCKREKCWDTIREYEYQLSSELTAELISVERPLVIAASPINSINSVTEDEQALIGEAALVPSTTWFALSRWAKETNNFQPWQRSLLFQVGTIVGRNQRPSYKQSTQALKVYKEAQNKGYSVQ